MLRRGGRRWESLPGKSCATVRLCCRRVDVDARLDGQHADRLVVALATQGQVAGPVDGQARWMLPICTMPPSGRALRASCRGAGFQLAPSGSQSTELATMARLSSGVMARFTGGPMIEFISGRLATIFGASRSVMSMMEMVSLPGAARARLPSASNAAFSSFADDNELGARATRRVASVRSSRIPEVHQMARRRPPSTLSASRSA